MLYCIDCRRGPSVLAPTAHKPSGCLWAWSGENFLGPSRCWWVGHRIGRRTGRAAVEAWMAAQHRSERPPPKSTTGGRRSRGAVLLILLLGHHRSRDEGGGHAMPSLRYCASVEHALCQPTVPHRTALVLFRGLERPRAFWAAHFCLKGFPAHMTRGMRCSRH